MRIAPEGNRLLQPLKTDQYLARLSESRRKSGIRDRSRRRTFNQRPESPDPSLPGEAARSQPVRPRPAAGNQVLIYFIAPADPVGKTRNNPGRDSSSLKSQTDKYAIHALTSGAGAGVKNLNRKVTNPRRILIRTDFSNPNLPYKKRLFYQKPVVVTFHPLFIIPFKGFSIWFEERFPQREKKSPMWFPV